MSAPQTNIERQKRKHRGPLIGILVAAAIAAVFFLMVLGESEPSDTTVPLDATAPATTQPVAPAGN